LDGTISNLLQRGEVVREFWVTLFNFFEILGQGQDVS
jgi:hypothetical protein